MGNQWANLPEIQAQAVLMGQLLELKSEDLLEYYVKENEDGQ